MKYWIVKSKFSWSSKYSHEPLWLVYNKTPDGTMRFKAQCSMYVDTNKEIHTYYEPGNDVNFPSDCICVEFNSLEDARAALFVEML